ncbi:hypothetical protein BDK51DRAFT_31148 [Blyttiomyces helicus]|uniref:Uncharacterized protein n=1 Tax=Blyttiomyces helicus TaxID=388810 RepID=A0A4P9WII5_9FUNG|nr:hypothetical protein BDK51DRAFT_31148 [Blyttiomyces helicus]|eukprot:RKO92594.1 hypothetical protein BDK51DRAFT_31148 [Blyttiomyces helicus]
MSRRMHGGFGFSDSEKQAIKNKYHNFKKSISHGISSLKNKYTNWKANRHLNIAVEAIDRAQPLLLLSKEVHASTSVLTKRRGEAPYARVAVPEAGQKAEKCLVVDVTISKWLILQPVLLYNVPHVQLVLDAQFVPD